MITFRNVSFIYPDSRRQILNDVSFGIAKGDFAVIHGATGSGKSTILHLLTCEAIASGGEIRVGPFDLSHISRSKIPEYRRSIGCVFQDFKLLEEKTVAENVAFALEVQRKFKADSISRQVDLTLERVGMEQESNKFPRELSLGGKQRTAIARALVTEPLVLLADGATAQLDEETAAGIFEILTSENIRGMTVLLTTTSPRFQLNVPKTATYFELHEGKVDAFLPVF